MSEGNVVGAAAKTTAAATTKVVAVTIMVAVTAGMAAAGKGQEWEHQEQ